MTTQLLEKKIQKIEREIEILKKPKSVLSGVYVDEKLIASAKKSVFDFDIEKFVSKKDLKIWKKSS